MSNYDKNDNDSKIVRTETRIKDDTVGAGVGVGIIGVIVLVIVLAIAAFLMFNKKHDTPASVGQDVGHAVSTVVDETKDVAAEVPQAAKDAVTEGDQKTTRPNSDGSTNKLDQK